LSDTYRDLAVFTMLSMHCDHACACLYCRLQGRSTCNTWTWGLFKMKVLIVDLLRLYFKNPPRIIDKIFFL